MSFYDNQSLAQNSRLNEFRRRHDECKLRHDPYFIESNQKSKQENSRLYQIYLETSDIKKSNYHQNIHSGPESTYAFIQGPNQTLHVDQSCKPRVPYGPTKSSNRFSSVATYSTAEYVFSQPNPKFSNNMNESAHNTNTMSTNNSNISNNLNISCVRQYQTTTLAPQYFSPSISSRPAPAPFVERSPVVRRHLQHHPPATPSTKQRMMAIVSTNNSTAAFVDYNTSTYDLLPPPYTNTISYCETNFIQSSSSKQLSMNHNIASPYVINNGRYCLDNNNNNTNNNQISAVGPNNLINNSINPNHLNKSNNLNNLTNVPPGQYYYNNNNERRSHTAESYNSMNTSIMYHHNQHFKEDKSQRNNNSLNSKQQQHDYQYLSREVDPSRFVSSTHMLQINNNVNNNNYFQGTQNITRISTLSTSSSHNSKFSLQNVGGAWQERPNFTNTGATSYAGNPNVHHFASNFVTSSEYNSNLHQGLTATNRFTNNSWARQSVDGNLMNLNHQGTTLSNQGNYKNENLESIPTEQRFLNYYTPSTISITVYDAVQPSTITPLPITNSKKDNPSATTNLTIPSFTVSPNATKEEKAAARKTYRQMVKAQKLAAGMPVKERKKSKKRIEEDSLELAGYVANPDCQLLKTDNNSCSFDLYSQPSTTKIPNNFSGGNINPTTLIDENFSKFYQNPSYTSLTGTLAPHQPTQTNIYDSKSKFKDFSELSSQICPVTSVNNIQAFLDTYQITDDLINGDAFQDILIGVGNANPPQTKISGNSLGSHTRNNSGQLYQHHYQNNPAKIGETSVNSVTLNFDGFDDKFDVKNDKSSAVKCTYASSFPIISSDTYSKRVCISGKNFHQTTSPSQYKSREQVYSKISLMVPEEENHLIKMDRLVNENSILAATAPAGNHYIPSQRSPNTITAKEKNSSTITHTQNNTTYKKSNSGRKRQNISKASSNTCDPSQHTGPSNKVTPNKSANLKSLLSNNNNIDTQKNMPVFEPRYTKLQADEPKCKFEGRAYSELAKISPLPYAPGNKHYHRGMEYYPKGIGNNTNDYNDPYTFPSNNQSFNNINNNNPNQTYNSGLQNVATLGHQHLAPTQTHVNDDTQLSRSMFCDAKPDNHNIIVSIDDLDALFEVDECSSGSYNRFPTKPDCRMELNGGRLTGFCNNFTNTSNNNGNCNYNKDGNLLNLDFKGKKERSGSSSNSSMTSGIASCSSALSTGTNNSSTTTPNTEETNFLFFQQQQQQQINHELDVLNEFAATADFFSA